MLDSGVASVFAMNKHDFSSKKVTQMQTWKGLISYYFAFSVNVIILWLLRLPVRGVALQTLITG